MDRVGGPSDVLALTPISMLSLDILNIPYNVTDNYYNTDLYKKDIKRIIGEAENVLNKLDKICQDFLHFPFAYSGNSPYFFYTILDLLYIDRLCLKLRQNYQKIYFYGYIKSEKIFWDRITFSNLESNPGGLISLNLTSGIDNHVRLLCDKLKVKILFNNNVDNNRTTYKIRFFVYLFRLKTILKNIKNILIEYIISKMYALFEKLKSGKDRKTIFIVQDYYEVEQLKPSLRKFRFIYPNLQMRKRASKLSINKYDYKQIKKLLKPFRDSHFSFFSENIEHLFKAYHEEIVSRIPFYIKSIDKLILNNNPLINLCSVGTRDVVDCIINYQANKKNIPVVFFQHGSTLIFVNDMFQKYVGADYKIKKTLILNSKIEKDTFNQKGSYFKVFGSIKNYKALIHSQKKINHKAIYCAGPFTFENYRKLFTASISDREYYFSSSQIVDAAKNTSLIMDIKTHPTDNKSQLNYFNKLLERKKYNSGELIGNIPAESILNKYGLIIIDFLGTALLPYILGLKVPVILYLKDNNLINPLAFNDLDKRCYILNNEKQLLEMLQIYTQNKLPHKWSKEIIDKYVYPINKGKPVDNISNYINFVISKR